MIVTGVVIHHASFVSLSVGVESFRGKLCTEPPPPPTRRERLSVYQERTYTEKAPQHRQWAKEWQLAEYVQAGG